MTTEKKPPRAMPKGGRKGGTIFPRVSLQDALGYARKLVTKTHVASLPQDVIFSGVMGAKGGKGAVRASALKQYGLMKGDQKTGFTASDLAKKIAASPHDELVDLYRAAVLKPAVFKSLAQTFHGDTVSRAKLKQRAADLKVHPDETETCIDLYLSGMVTAKLVTVDGDQATHLVLDNDKSDDGSGDIADPPALIVGQEDPELPQTDPDPEERGNAGEQVQGGEDGVSRQRAVFNVNVTLDSSLDIEKLSKQLELLKRFGAI